jgi:NAD(P)-dependent dehydrogenase (short-subunit alcohol dehydrogenase family)
VAGCAPVGILVNNAGNAGPGDEFLFGSFVDSDPSDWDRYFSVNLFGVMYCTRAVLPAMVERSQGRVITIVSEAGRWGHGRMAAYSAAKAGAAGFTRALARDVGRHGITVNNVSLGTVDTMGFSEAAAASPERAERLQRQLRSYIVPRFGRADDVTGLVTFLASPMASWITGQTYPVNGGFTVNQ